MKFHISGKKRDYYVSFVSTKNFPFRHMRWWFFMFKRSTYVDSFECRVCGVHVKAVEKGAFEKLIGIAREQSAKKRS